jgi:hypothetical protein
MIARPLPLAPIRDEGETDEPADELIDARVGLPLAVVYGPFATMTEFLLAK